VDLSAENAHEGGSLAPSPQAKEALPRTSTRAIQDANLKNRRRKRSGRQGSQKGTNL